MATVRTLHHPIVIIPLKDAGMVARDTVVAWSLRFRHRLNVSTMRTLECFRVLVDPVAGGLLALHAIVFRPFILGRPPHLVFGLAYHDTLIPKDNG